MVKPDPKMIIDTITAIEKVADMIIQNLIHFPEFLS